MENHWDRDAILPNGESGQLVYVTRLLGHDEALNLHGGGNTSAKQKQTGLPGEDEEILYIDNGLVSPEYADLSGFTPVRRQPLAALVQWPALSIEQLENELACSRKVAAAPVPPPETILHAALPYRFVLSAQPDVVLAIASTSDGPQRLHEIFGDAVLVLPYAATGLHLARACAEALREQAAPALVGMLVMYQRLYTFGETARQAYEHMVELVNQAERYLDRHAALRLPSTVTATAQPEKPAPREVAALRKSISAVAGYSLILQVHDDADSLAFSQRPDAAELTRQGPATAQNVALTRRLPMLGRDVDAYHEACQQAFDEYDPQSTLPRPDLAPRIVLDAQLGLCALGRTAAEAALAARVYRHTTGVLLRAKVLGGYQSLPPATALALESRHFATSPSAGWGGAAPFTGEIALVTGGASGIGKACVESLLARGAAVATMDVNPRVSSMLDRPDFLGLPCDLTDEAAILRAFEVMVKTFGGLDMLVLNAGIFPAGCRIESLSLAEWRKVMQINLDSNLVVLREAYPLLKLSPRGGRVVVNASKNVLAPGAGAAAYSSSKAAVTQLARVAALEWGKDGIRVNMVHPDAIFDTGIWTEEVLKARAAHYGLTVPQYKTRNVLGVELNSHYVGELVAEMLGPRFEKITGAQIPVDGGSDRVI